MGPAFETVQGLGDGGAWGRGERGGAGGVVPGGAGGVAPRRRVEHAGPDICLYRLRIIFLLRVAFFCYAALRSIFCYA